MSKKKQQANFRITLGKGFQVTFANGYTVSVQFGPGDYCNNRFAEQQPLEETLMFWQRVGEEGSPNAETAVIGPDDNFVKRHPEDADDVQAYQTPEDVLQTMLWAALQKGGK